MPATIRRHRRHRERRTPPRRCRRRHLVGPLRRAGGRARASASHASVDFDRRLARADIAGSLAHARMLAAQRHPAPRRPGRDRARPGADRARDRRAASSSGRSTLEDVHLNIERRLTELVGDAGKRLHTGALAQRPGRDRRAAVAARRDRRARARSWSRCARALLELAERHADTIMPGFTHLQVAQPVTFGHHLLAYVEMLARDAERFARLPQARQPAAARRRGARRHELPDRPRARRARARLRRRVRRTRSTRCPTATSRSSSRPRRRSSWCTCRASPRSWCCGSSPRFGFVDSPTASAPARRSCRRRRTPTCPSSCAARPAASSAT